MLFEKLLGIQSVPIVVSHNQLYAWGDNSVGELGNSTTVTASTPQHIGTSSWLQAAAGSSFTAAILSDYTLWTWGSNYYGQLGVATGVFQNQIISPIVVSSALISPLTWLQVFTGWAGFTTYAIRSDNTLWAWGDNGSGQLGVLSTAVITQPVLVSGPVGASWSFITTGAHHTLGITTTGLLYSWGSNSSGQLGLNLPTSAVVSSPVLVSGPIGASWSTVAAGNSHSLAITSTGRLYAWGSNTNGPLGNLSTVTVSSPVLVSGPATTSWSSVTAGASHSLAITSIGALYGWGLNTSGQVGIGSLTTVSSPVLVTGPAAGTSWSAVSAGASTTLGITSVGRLYGWGYNGFNQIGNLVTTNTSSPVLVSGPTTTSWNFVSSGQYASFARTTNNQLYAWGYNNLGQLGTNTVLGGGNSSPVLVSTTTAASWVISSFVQGTEGAVAISTTGVLWAWGSNSSGETFPGPYAITSPIQIGVSSWTSVAAGASHTLGITVAGVLYGWGLNTSGQVGTGTATTTYTSPVAVYTAPVLSSWKQVSANNSGSHTVAIRSDGTLWAWGLNTSGQVGNNSATTVSSPVLVSGPSGASWLAASAGGGHSLGITTTGQLYGWGSNSSGQVGNNSGATVSSPVLVAAPAGLSNVSWSVISAGASHSLGIATTGLLYGWGASDNGQVGIYSLAASSSPVVISTPSIVYSWKQVSANNSGSHTVAIRSDGTLWAWGLNTSGQVGNNSATTVSSPVLVSGPSGASWLAASAGGGHSLGITTTGQLYGWGSNSSGQVGTSSILSVSSPVLVSGPVSTSWSYISAGALHSQAITATGILYGWGQNTVGQAGIGSYVSISVPVVVKTPALFSWLQVSANNSGTHTLAVKSDGTLWAWGLNGSGQVGNNSTTTVSSPVLVSGPTGASWVVISAGGSHSLGITTSGILYAWGLNTIGQLGINSLANLSTPTVVPFAAALSWQSVSMGSWQSSHTVAIRSDGTLWAWGNNANGQLGINNNVIASVSSPVLVSGPAGASWTVVAAGDQHTVGVTTIGILYAWGYNGYGQLGINSLTTVSSPVLVSGPIGASWSTVAAGYITTFGITTTGILYGWGLNGLGQVGNNSTTTVSSPVLVSGPTGASWTSVQAGASSTMGITTVGVLYGWGYNGYGQLGNSSTVTVSSPVLVSGPAGASWIKVAAGDEHTLAILTTGVLYGWGLNTNGQVGISSSTSVSRPALVSGPTGASWTSVSAGASYSLGITSTGQLYGWGTGGWYTLGNLSSAGASVPTLVSGPAGSSWVSVTAGAYTAFGITSGQFLYAWGQSGFGQLGNFSTSGTSSPVLINAPAPISWTTVSAGASHTLGIAATGILYGWGYNNTGQVGNNSVTPVSSPVVVTNPTAFSWLTVSANANGGTHTLAIRSDSTLWAWGNNTLGQLGIFSTTLAVSSPVLVSGPVGALWASVSAGGSHTLAITTQGLLYGWGISIASGQSSITSSPVLVSAPAGLSNVSWSVISAGATHSVAITTTRMLYAWGDNTYGELGLLTTGGAYSVPVLVSGPTNASWSTISAGYYSTFGITTAGRLYAWGLNTSGQLGTLSATTVSSPVLVSGPAATSWSAVSAGLQFAVGITSVGVLYAWGQNGNGQLGTNSTTNVSSPVLVSAPTGLSNVSWSAVSAGTSYTIGITTSNLLYGWGLNTSGQVGINSTTGVSIPTLVSGPTTTSWTSISAGSSFALAITSGQLLYGWGQNTSGQVGINSITTVSSPVIVNNSVIISWTSVSAGASHSLGINTTGLLYGWGQNTSGQLGINSLTTTYGPVLASGTAGTSWSIIAAGASHSLGITTTGILYGWGQNTSGQLGIGSLTTVSSPVVVTNTVSWTSVSAGASHTVGITTTGLLYGWGLNTSGQLGIASLVTQILPTLLSGPTGVSWTSVTAGASFSLGITNTNLLYGWGQNTSGQVGISSVTTVSSPVLVQGPFVSSWTAVATGASHSIGITTTGILYGWGQNTSGQVGNNSLTTTNVPVLVSGTVGASWTAVAAGSLYSMGITTTGILYGWGQNTSGQVGNNSIVTVSSPVAAGGLALSVWKTVSYGGIHTLAIQTDGTLWAWGYNNTGQLGINSSIATDILSPTLVSGPIGASWAAIAAGAYHSLAITTTGILYGWGQNTSGQVGINSITTVSSPVLVSGPVGASWIAISSGASQSHSVAITSTGLLYAWGLNTSGQLGILTTTPVSSPVLVSGPASTSWSLVTSATNNGFAVTNTGTLWAWGDNSFGQLGINTLVTGGVSSPVLVSGPTNASWTVVTSNYGSIFGITTTNQLYGWGQNTSGQVGINSLTTVSSPVLVSGPAGASWTAVSAGYSHTVGITISGQLYAWGTNTSGQLGTNSLTTVSSPVLVSGPTLTSWSAIAGGSFWSGAITTTGLLYGWGQNTSGQLGIGSLTTVSSPVVVTNTVSWTSVSAGASHTVGITTTGLLYGWGLNTSGQLGIASLVTQILPTLLSGPTGVSWTSVTAGASFSLGITNTNLLYGWGQNTAGQLGINSVNTMSLPAAVNTAGIVSWTGISAGGVHSLGITTTGLLWGWGGNTSGQVGINSLANVSSPVLVSGPAGASWSVSSAGASHSLGISTTGILYGWGWNTSGQAGINSVVTVSSPVATAPPGALLSWNSLAIGTSHTIGIRSDGTLWSWGNNTYGQLGINTSGATTGVSSPVLVSGPTGASWASVTAGVSHSIAVTTAGQLYAWGGNTLGQLGNTNTLPVFSPVLVSGPAGASWTVISAGGNQTFGITSTGLLYAWGNNGSSQLGINGGLLAFVSSPVLVSGPAGASWTNVVSGYTHALAITTNGRLYAWGDNVAGEIGINTSGLPTLSPRLVSGPASTSWSAIAAGASFSLAITTTNLLYGWGLNSSGQVGISSISSVSTPYLVSGPTNASWSSVTAGASYSMGITTTGTLYGWGQNTSGQVGTKALTTVSFPVLVSGPAAVTSWAAVFAGSAGITTAAIPAVAPNGLYMWGLNTSGQAGINSLATVSSPVAVLAPVATSWSLIAAGGGHSLGITTTGQLYGWGNNGSGQVGTGSLTTVSLPTLVSGPATASWTNITAGTAYSLGITNNNLLYGWGDATYGQTGLASTTAANIPILVYNPSATSTSWTSVAAGQYFSLGITTNNAIAAWGSGAGGNLGNYGTTATYAPVAVQGIVGTSWSLIAAGQGHSLATTSAGVLYAWGTNTSGQLGINSTVGVSSPVSITAYPGILWKSVSLGLAGSHTVAIRTDNTVWAWGDNTTGALGTNSLVSVSSPVLVSGPAGASWFSVSTGIGFSVAISSAGRLYAWGLNNAGQLGINSLTNTSSPVLVSGPAGASWSSVSAGNSFVLAITTTRQLYGWGWNGSGQVGINSLTTVSSPVLVSGPAGASWASVASGYYHSMAISTTGILYGWGDNTAYQLGTLSTTSVSTPVLVSGPTNASWSLVAAGVNYNLAITTAGILYSWGAYDGTGGLGLLANCILGASSPVLVSGPVGASWSVVGIGLGGGGSSGYDYEGYSVGITSSKYLYTWGCGGEFNLGTGTYVSVSSPVLVSGPTGASWASVSGGTFGITTTGLLYAWGQNLYGELGTNSTALTSGAITLPTAVYGPTAPAISSWSAIAAGGVHSLGITSLGALYAWGSGGGGQLGTSSLTTVSSPVLVSGPTGALWTSVAAGLSHSLGITTTGVLYAWGVNTSGQLGIGSLTSVSTPVQVTMPQGMSSVAQGPNAIHSVGITT